MSTEIELKFAVAGEDSFDALVRHLDLPAREFHSAALQVNHFFDTQAFRLQERHITLRLREETGRYVLCLKGPSSSASDVVTERLEEELRLAPGIALDVLQGTLSPRDALARHLTERNPSALAMLDEALGRNELHYIGRFENRRTRMSPVNVEIAGTNVAIVFELDQTQFGEGRVDHEIEVELDAGVDIDAARTALVALIGSAGIEWSTSPSKAQRFFALIRAGE